MNRIWIGATAMTILLFAGCGGNGSSSGLATLADTPSATPDTDNTESASEVTSTVQSDSEMSEADNPSGTTAGATARPTPEELENMTDEERLLVFAQCFRDNGVDFPDPIMQADGSVAFGLLPGGEGDRQRQNIARDPDLPAAREACEGLFEGLPAPGRRNFDEIERQDSLLEFAQCMRENGVDMGDPNLHNFGPGADNTDQPSRPFGDIDFNDPDVTAAMNTCQEQLAQGTRIPRLGRGGRDGQGNEQS